VEGRGRFHLLPVIKSLVFQRVFRGGRLKGGGQDKNGGGVGVIKSIRLLFRRKGDRGRNHPACSEKKRKARGKKSLNRVPRSWLGNHNEKGGGKGTNS